VRKEVFSFQKYRVNERIRAREVRVVDPQGRQIGIMPVIQALRLAREIGLDLVEVAPSASPPVCRIMDYGKFKYQQKKREKEARKRQKSQEVKEVKFRPSINEHDLKRKIESIKEFLEESYKIRVIVRFRGAEIGYLERGRNLLNRVLNEVGKQAQVEKPPYMEGRQMVMILSPR